VQGICSFLIRQVLLLIWRVRTPLRDLLNPIRQVILFTSHIFSYTPYFSHLLLPSLFLVLNSTIIAEHNVKSSLSISPCHDHELTPSSAYTYSTASTHDCRSSLHSHDDELTPECSYSFRHASLHDQPPSASCP
jgi:hypothetical protein